ncbi:hypothetical protein FLM9_470 [Candidatus Synechococcus spongiarum]|uniref:Mobile element protein n=1 Tax=Candidatus Synechococcus spongiarum TaxID=431041 RepID=A0A164YW21_9SYNE|nr:hypothetical protein FLM9_470 [Candidatus Synechococcus spongiarum]
MAKEFTALRNNGDLPWLHAYSFKTVRAALQSLSLAFQAFFSSKGHLRLKARGRDQPRFTIPDGVKIQGEHLRIPGLGLVRRQRHGGNPYPTQGMTRSAQGTVASPGRNVQQKAGLNRSVLSTGWSEMGEILGYKTRVVHVNPAYTSPEVLSLWTGGQGLKTEPVHFPLHKLRLPG